MSPFDLDRVEQAIGRALPAHYRAVTERYPFVLGSSGHDCPPPPIS